MGECIDVMAARAYNSYVLTISSTHSHMNISDTTSRPNVPFVVLIVQPKTVLQHSNGMHNKQIIIIQCSSREYICEQASPADGENPLFLSLSAAVSLSVHHEMLCTATNHIGHCCVSPLRVCVCVVCGRLQYMRLCVCDVHCNPENMGSIVRAARGLWSILVAYIIMQPKRICRSQCHTMCILYTCFIHMDKLFIIFDSSILCLFCFFFSPIFPLLLFIVCCEKLHGMQQLMKHPMFQRAVACSLNRMGGQLCDRGACECVHDFLPEINIGQFVIRVRRFGFRD